MAKTKLPLTFEEAQLVVSRRMSARKKLPRLVNRLIKDFDGMRTAEYDGNTYRRDRLVANIRKLLEDLK